jgi:hypothetical protein
VNFRFLLCLACDDAQLLERQLRAHCRETELAVPHIPLLVSPQNIIGYHSVQKLWE